MKRLITLLIILTTMPAWAQYKVDHLGKPYNTPGSETGAIIVGDTVLVYSSLPPSERGNREFHFNTSITQLLQSRISRSTGKLARPKPCRWGLNSSKDHTANLAIDPVKHDLYFTRCRADDPTLRCDIWYARKLKRGWDKPHKVAGPLNNSEHTSTHPAVGKLPDGSTILYFSSNRPGGSGGMDIWYTIVADGTAGECVNLGPQVNTHDDEITPFYDQRNGVLYFSSDRAGGRGGHDIYCAVGQRNTWQKAEAVCGCLNSEQNDIYYVVTHHDSVTGMPVAGYLSSNRSDSFFMTDSTCCNDIYRWSLDSLWLQARNEAAARTLDSLQHLPPPRPNFMFPLFLYFHNDDPDPMSRAATTTTDYATCQQRLAAMRNEYIAHQTSAADSAMMRQFFDTCVEGNYRRIEQLLEFIASMIGHGDSITLTIAGYASPVFNDDYNRILSERRIASFINMLHTWHGGALETAIADGLLVISQRPRGAVATSVPTQSADPVYGLPAAMSRRIEIISCEVR